MVRYNSAVSGPLIRLLHTFDTMVTIAPSTLPGRLVDAGFTDIAIDVRARGFRFRARPASYGHATTVSQNGAS